MKNNYLCLEVENVNIEEEKKALMKQFECQQGNLSEYTERQAHQQATLDKKALESDNFVIKRALKTLNLPSKNWNKRRTTGTKTSGLSVMRNPTKMNSSTS